MLLNNPFSQGGRRRCHLSYNNSSTRRETVGVRHVNGDKVYDQKPLIRPLYPLLELQPQEELGFVGVVWEGSGLYYSSRRDITKTFSKIHAGRSFEIRKKKGKNETIGKKLP